MQGPLKLKYLVFGNGKEDLYKSLGHLIRIIFIISVAGLILLGGLNIWNWLFPKKPVQTNSQTVKVEKGATANITNNYTQNTEKNNEVGLFGGGVTLGDKNGVFGGVEVKRRF